MLNADGSCELVFGEILILNISPNETDGFFEMNWCVLQRKLYDVTSDVPPETGPVIMRIRPKERVVRSFHFLGGGEMDEVGSPPFSWVGS